MTSQFKFEWILILWADEKCQLMPEKSPYFLHCLLPTQTCYTPPENPGSQFGSMYSLTHFWKPRSLQWPGVDLHQPHLFLEISDLAVNNTYLSYALFGFLEQPLHGATFKDDSPASADANAAARLLTGISYRDHITPLLTTTSLPTGPFPSLVHDL